MRRRAGTIAVGLLVLLALALLLRLGAQERGGPAHQDLSIGNGIPATLHVPFANDDGFLPRPKPPGQRPPVVVVGHGYSVDRNLISPLARSLARAGYATLSFDFRGHGSNTAAFQGDLRRDLDAIVDWLNTSAHVDPTRIAVLGHSMGGGAALDFATTDPRPLAVIPISGVGWFGSDIVVPRNALFLFAQRDAGFIQDRARATAAELRGKTNVQLVEIRGTDHATVLWSDKTVYRIVDFLDPIFGVTRTGPTPGIDDPRLPTAIAYLLIVLALVVITGRIVGGLAPSRPPSFATPGALLLLAGALLVTLPLMVSGGPSVLPIGAGQPAIVHLALAGAVLWIVRLLVQRGAVRGPVAAWVGGGKWLPLREVAGPGLAAAAVIFLLVSPLGAVSIRLVPTVERAILWAAVAAVALPFFAAFESLVRRGSPGAAAGWSALGRVISLGALLVGVNAGVLPGVLIVMVGALVFLYLVLELFAAGAYATSRNPALIAVVESVVVAWFVVMLSPIG